MYGDTLTLLTILIAFHFQRFIWIEQGILLSYYFYDSGGVSHSAMTDMKTIDQDVPTQAVTEGKSRILEDTLWSPRTQAEEEDDFVILSGTGATSALPYASKSVHSYAS